MEHLLGAPSLPYKHQANQKNLAGDKYSTLVFPLVCKFFTELWILKVFHPNDHQYVDEIPIKNKRAFPGLLRLIYTAKY
jgi:hypothetical protein